MKFTFEAKCTDRSRWRCKECPDITLESLHYSGGYVLWDFWHNGNFYGEWETKREALQHIENMNLEQLLDKISGVG